MQLNTSEDASTALNLVETKRLKKEKATDTSSGIMELRNWTIFGLMSDEFLASIKVACVFGNMGHEAVFVTKADEVYSIGSNCAGCLGTDNLAASLIPIKIDALCQKGIKGFSCGTGPHVIAFSEDGLVYSWGHNGFCQLGLGNSTQTIIPSVVGGSLVDKKVVQVACGSHHTMALTEDGEVFAWGQNSSGQVGCGSTASQPTPRRVSAVIGNNKMRAIACGQTSSFAISETGEVFTWGYNGNGQLGIGNTVNQYNPTKINFPQSSSFITKVVCGTAHTLALSDDGVLYTWGANSYGQLGTGHKSNVSNPTRVATEVGRIVDIGATHYGHISTCQTHTKVYMWGQCRGQAVVSPLETLFKTMHDVFACYSTPAVTWKCIEAKLTDDIGITQAIKLAFDDPITSDIKFQVDGKLIHVHKAILRIRSDHFRSMFQGRWEENTENVIPAPVVEVRIRYPVFRAFLQYLYTDKIELPAEDALDLLKLANYYCEAQLKSECEMLIKQSITVDNAARLYASSIQYNAKELEEFSFQYMLHHLTAVVKSETFTELTGGTLMNLMVILANNGAFKF